MKLHKAFVSLASEAVLALSNNLMFESKNFKKMMNDIKNSDKAKELDIDITKNNGFNWESYMDTQVVGIQSNIFKEDPLKNSQNLSRLSKMYWKDVSALTTLFFIVFSPFLYVTIY